MKIFCVRHCVKACRNSNPTNTTMLILALACISKAEQITTRTRLEHLQVGMRSQLRRAPECTNAVAHICTWVRALERYANIVNNKQLINSYGNREHGLKARDTVVYCHRKKASFRSLRTVRSDFYSFRRLPLSKTLLNTITIGQHYKSYGLQDL